MKNEENVNNFLNSRYFAVVMLVVAIVFSFSAILLGSPDEIETPTGLFLPSVGNWIGNPYVSWGVNIILISAIGILTIFLNKTFSVVRSLTSIFSSMFIIMAGCEPMVSVALNSSSVFCLVAITCTVILFYSYQAPHLRRPIYLIFVILGACSFFQYAYLFLMIIFIIGVIQMQSLSIKGIVAILLGVITPSWILLGLGVVAIDSFRVPTLLPLFMVTDFADYNSALIAIGVTALFALTLLAINMISIYRYKLQIRAYNGFISVLMLFSLLMIIIDFGNYITYIFLLNWCVAIQVAHFFTINNFKRKYLSILFFILVYIGIYATQLYFSI